MPNEHSGTPLAAARRLPQAGGSRATTITVDQGGRCVYSYGSNQCAKDAIVAFLATCERPVSDRTCAARAR